MNTDNTRCAVRFLFSAFCILLMIPAVLFADYKVVLKDGRVLEARTKPVSMEGHYRFTDTQNRFQAIAVELVDQKATQASNSGVELNARAAKNLTNDDISSKSPASVSSEQSDPVSPSKLGTSATKTDTTGSTAKKGEAYWRTQAKEIRDQMARIDNEIKALNEKTRSGKSDGVKIGFDTYNQVIYANFESELKELEKEKGKLQMKMMALEEEARKAGALPGWLR
jgi:hypothetical protein